MTERARPHRPRPARRHRPASAGPGTALDAGRVSPHRRFRAAPGPPPRAPRVAVVELRVWRIASSRPPPPYLGAQGDGLPIDARPPSARPSVGLEVESTELRANSAVIARPRPSRRVCRLRPLTMIQIPLRRGLDKPPRTPAAGRALPFPRNALDVITPHRKMRTGHASCARDAPPKTSDGPRIRTCAPPLRHIEGERQRTRRRPPLAQSARGICPRGARGSLPGPRSKVSGW